MMAIRESLANGGSVGLVLCLAGFALAAVGASFSGNLYASECEITVIAAKAAAVRILSVRHLQVLVHMAMAGIAVLQRRTAFSTTNFKWTSACYQSDTD